MLTVPARLGAERVTSAGADCGDAQEPCLCPRHKRYDHDVSACLLRDGEIAFAVGKERIAREKHDTGFFKVVDYCLSAENISLDDVDLVVRNCYVLPVEDLETRMVSQDVPEVMDDDERIQASRVLYSYRDRTRSSPSLIIWHTPTAPLPSVPSTMGSMMVVDGGNYSSDVTEPGQVTEPADPLRASRRATTGSNSSSIETLKKVWLEPVRGFLSDERSMPGLGALYSRVSGFYIFADWNKCGEVMGLAPYGRARRAEAGSQTEGQWSFRTGG